MNASILPSLILAFGFFFLYTPVYGQLHLQANKNDYRLIAHRGGIVDSLTAENSQVALEKAANEGYWMVEVDLRLTRDSILIIHHDSNFKRYYDVDRTVSEMTWEEIKSLSGKLGNRVLTFEEALHYCQKHGLEVMVDNKIRGNDTVLFASVVELLKKYDRLDQAMMIGTTESTPFFTGKIRLSCTRQQLEDNMLKPGYKPENYYLFSSSITKEDMEWATEHGLLAVGVLNAWTFRDNVLEGAQREAVKLKEAGVRYYQLDSMFDFMFK